MISPAADLGGLEFRVAIFVLGTLSRLIIPRRNPDINKSEFFSYSIDNGRWIPTAFLLSKQPPCCAMVLQFGWRC